MSDSNDRVNLLWALALAGVFAANQSLAGDGQEKKAASGEATESLQKQNESRPSLELLEYLGLYMVEQGEWVDPLEVEEMALSNKEDSRAEQQEDREG